MSIQDNEAIEQVQRLLRSKTFETSEVHRKLLQYLCDKTLAGEADRLKEYVIGLEAFGKPATYDPKQDSIVRLQVGRLRQKLATYYQNEASGDPIVVSLPKGAFKLGFVKNEPNLPPPAQSPQNWKLILGVSLIAVTAWAAIATVWMLRLRAHAGEDRWNAELETLWNPFLQSRRPMMASLGTPLFVRIPNFGFFRDPKANDWEEIEASERISSVRRLLGVRDVVPNYHFTGSGEAGAAFLIAQLLSTRKHTLLLTPGNILSWQQIKDDDVVFLGPPKYNRPLETAALTRDIVIEPEGVRNLKPRPGEPSFLPDRIVAGKPSEGETHALISRTPGPSGKGEMLVIAGNASPDTFAAAEWLTDQARARELIRHLRSPQGEVPRYFQVVLKVSFKQGIPVESSYLFHHAL